MLHNWSRSVLFHQIENGLYQREGKSINNFSITLPKPQSDLANQTLKDPYIFDFLTMTKEYDEHDLKRGLSGKGKIVQYAGRLHRYHKDKRDVCIYDYVDINVSVLAKMFQKRLKTYKMLGYSTDGIPPLP